MSLELVLLSGITFIKKDGMHFVSSREVASRFSKQHKDVLRLYEEKNSALCSCGMETFSRRNFAPRDYVDTRGKSQPEILMTRDGFALLALGLTGVAASQWQVQFIEAFTELERVVLEEIPRLRAEIQRKEAVIQSLQNRPQLQQHRTSSNRGKIFQPVQEETMPGFPPRIEWKMQPIPAQGYETMEYLIGRLAKIERTLEGLTNSRDKTKELLFQKHNSRQ